MIDKKSDSSNIKFEELDKNDNTMKEIFENIENLPDKDKILEILKLKSFEKKKKNYPFKLVSKPEKEIDLHGKTIDESIIIVKNFLKKCYVNRLKNVLIITGKGNHSGKKGPVLNKEIKYWLKNNSDSYFIDFYDAPPRFGGSGAIWIVFKKIAN